MYGIDLQTTCHHGDDPRPQPLAPKVNATNVHEGTRSRGPAHSCGTWPVMGTRATHSNPTAAEWRYSPSEKIKRLCTLHPLAGPLFRGLHSLHRCVCPAVCLQNQLLPGTSNHPERPNAWLFPNRRETNAGRKPAQTRSPSQGAADVREFIKLTRFSPVPPKQDISEATPPVFGAGRRAV